jgi:hypothetical protein
LRASHLHLVWWGHVVGRSGAGPCAGAGAGPDAGGAGAAVERVGTAVRAWGDTLLGCPWGRHRRDQEKACLVVHPCCLALAFASRGSFLPHPS